MNRNTILEHFYFRTVHITSAFLNSISGQRGPVKGAPAQLLSLPIVSFNSKQNSAPLTLLTEGSAVLTAHTPGGLRVTAQVSVGNEIKKKKFQRISSKAHHMWNKN